MIKYLNEPAIDFNKVQDIIYWSKKWEISAYQVMKAAFVINTNSITSSAGILFGLVSIPILVWNATNHASKPVAAGDGIYGLSFLMLFTFSALFHWKKEGRIRKILKILDHISIYFLIAGTYTPFI